MSILKTYSFNSRDSELVMLLKNAEYKAEHKPKVFEKPLEEKLNQPIVYYTCLLEWFTKHFNTIEVYTFEELEKFFIKYIGDILFEIDPHKFKIAVYDSSVVSTSFSKQPLVELLIHQIRMLNMKNILLDDNIKDTMEGKFI